MANTAGKSAVVESVVLRPWTSSPAASLPSRASSRTENGPTPSSSPVGARFLREARLQLDRPGVVAVYDLARRPDGTLFCAQKLIRGETLRVHLARCKSLRQRLALLPHLIDACQAVAYAIRAGHHTT
jgi:hypothetical protein